MKRISSKLNLLLVLVFALAILQACALPGQPTSQQGSQPATPPTNQPSSINTSPLAKPTSPVMDYANVLDDATKQQIEKKIIAFRDSTNPRVELAVAIVQTTGDRDIFDYSVAVARGWGIGSKESDNPGALLLIAINDRKYFTQVSRDLEDELPDGAVGSLQRQYLIPAFKQQQYGKGISDTIDAYISTIRAKQSGEPTPAVAVNQRSESVHSSGGISGTMTCLIILFVLLILIFSRMGGGRGGRGGGGGGGGFGSALPWIIGSVLSSGGGRSSGSSWGGGSSSSGGSDWGGFGGGGDFGGGGSGGSW